MRRALAALLLLFAAPALGLFLKPELAFNSRTAAWALRRLGAAYAPRWSALELSLRGAGLSKRLAFRAEGLCAEGPAFSGCAPELRLEADLRLGLSPLLRVARVETLILRAGPLTARGTAGGGGEPRAVPAALRGATLGTLEVELSSAALVSPGGRVSGHLRARSSGEGRLSAAASVVTLSTGSPPLERRYELSLSADSDLWREGRLTYLDAEARLRVAADRALSRGSAASKALGAATLDARARVEPRAGGADARADVRARWGRRLLRARLTGSLEGRRLAARGGAEAEDPEGPLRRAALDGCRLDAALAGERRGLESGALACRLTLEPAPFGGPRGGRLRALSGPLTARLGPDRRSLRAELGAADGVVARLEAREESGRRTARLDVERFQALAAYIQDTRFAIPAPFNVLQGSVAAHAELTASALAYGAVTTLSGRRQRLHAAARGTGRLAGGAVAGAETELRLEDVALELPPFELGPVPRMTVDKRIARRDAAPAAPARASLEHRLRVVTARPVLLYTDLLPEPVPVSLDLSIAPEGLSGRIRVESFRLKVFGQEGRVRHVTLTPSGIGPAMELDGLIATERAGTAVRILLSGTTKAPQVSFESDPPMDRAEIVGLLLYGKHPSELGGEEQASAGNASAAFAAGAFGLASLYLFSATPIETVGYDPATQSYQVTFKLPAGTSLGVGSDLEESRTLTLRKRLGRRFEVETEVETRPEEENAVTTFLQWFMRY